MIFTKGLLRVHEGKNGWADGLEGSLFLKLYTFPVEAILILILGLGLGG